jgi:two-component system, chemotaxis family, chemotaxis protein CheY
MLRMSSEGWAPSECSAAEAPTVLLVDDELDVVSALSELLEDEGYNVATATDGIDALNQLRRGLRPSVIVLDLMMPRMDGWDFRQEQLKDDVLKDIPTVVLSAAGFTEATIKAQFGDIEFVPKPSGHTALLGALRRTCAEHESH